LQRDIQHWCSHSNEHYDTDHLLGEFFRDRVRGLI